jgi:hypothetical protein
MLLKRRGKQNFRCFFASENISNTKNGNKRKINNREKERYKHYSIGDQIL